MKIPLRGVEEFLQAVKRLGFDVPAVVREEMDPRLLASSRALMSHGKTPRPHNFYWRGSTEAPGAESPFLMIRKTIPNVKYAEAIRERYGDEIPLGNLGKVAAGHELGHHLIATQGPQRRARILEGIDSVWDNPRFQDAHTMQLQSEYFPEVEDIYSPRIKNFISHNLRPEEIESDAVSRALMNMVDDAKTGQQSLFPALDLPLEEVLHQRQNMAELRGQWRKTPAWLPRTPTRDRARQRKLW